MDIKDLEEDYVHAMAKINTLKEVIDRHHRDFLKIRAFALAGKRLNDIAALDEILDIVGKQ